MWTVKAQQTYQSVLEELGHEIDRAIGAGPGAEDALKNLADNLHHLEEKIRGGLQAHATQHAQQPETLMQALAVEMAVRGDDS